MRLGILATALVLLVVWAAWLFSGSGIGRYTTPPTERPQAPTASAPADEAAPTPATSPATQDDLGALWWIVWISLFLATLAAAATVRARVRARRRLQMKRYWLVPGRADEATPEQVRALLEAWHQQLLRRWWRRLRHGQPPLALEVYAVRDDVGVQLRFALACPDLPGLFEALDGRLRSCYPDARLDPVDAEVPPPGAIVRLKKRDGFSSQLRIPDHDNDRLMDGVAATMTGTNEHALVQYVLTPVPGAFDALARLLTQFSGGRPRAGRDQASAHRRADPPSGEALFFCDIRVAADRPGVCEAVADAVRAGAGENRLVPRRIVVRRALYQQRIAKAVANPLPSWLRGVVSTSELAGLWHLPSPFLAGVRGERSSIPRVPAPPEIQRPKRETEILAHDELGPLGMWPEDRHGHMAMIGPQGTAKTSLMLRAIARDAQDRNKALIVFDPKTDLSDKALSAIPPDRTVHYLNFARPEIGFDPFEADADRDAIADGIVEAFKAVHEEGAIQAASDRYLRQAALAMIGYFQLAERDDPWVEESGVPTFWDMQEILAPSEDADRFREHVVKTIRRDPTLAATTKYFGRLLPDQLFQSRNQMVPRLDAPANKLMKICGVASLDRVVRHPVKVSIDRVIRNHEILVVNGAIGEFGEGSEAVLLHLLLHQVHRAVIRQQALPEPDRVPVVFAVDELHLLICDTLLRMLAMDRSSKLEFLGAWQSLGQIEDPRHLEKLLDLIRSWAVFALGIKGARQMADMLQTAHSDQVRDDGESRARLRISPDKLANLPNYRFAGWWLAQLKRVPSFIGETISMTEDRDRIGHHIEAQRARGAYFPEQLLPPRRAIGDRLYPDVPTGSLAEGNNQEPHPPQDGDPSEPADAGGPARSQEGLAPSAPPRFAPEATSVEARRDAVEAAALDTDTGDGAPASFTELEFDSPTGLRWDRKPPRAPDQVNDPSRGDLEILAALYELRFMFASQIARRYLAHISERTQQRRLSELFRNGWVRRFQVTDRAGGQAQRIYCLTREGFELAQLHRGPTGHYIDPRERWGEPKVEDARHVIHDLHAAGWLLALEALAANLIRTWRGPRRSFVQPPGKKVRGEWKPLLPSQVSVGGGSLADLQTEEFEPVRPDLTVELAMLHGTPQARRFDLMLELDRSGSASYNRRKFVKYDALISGWAMALERYGKLLGEPPVVLFVCPDEPKAREFAAAADKVVTARIAEGGVPEAEWQHPGRQRIFFAAERDVHMGSLRCYRVPTHPPEIRKRLEPRRRGRQEPAPQLEQVSLLPRRLLGRAAAAS